MGLGGGTMVKNIHLYVLVTCRKEQKQTKAEEIAHGYITRLSRSQQANSKQIPPSMYHSMDKAGSLVSRAHTSGCSCLIMQWFRCLDKVGSVVMGLHAPLLVPGHALAE